MCGSQIEIKKGYVPGAIGRVVDLVLTKHVVLVDPLDCLKGTRVETTITLTD